MGGRGDDRRAVRARPVDDDTSRLVEARAQLRDGRADPRAGFDLGSQELVDDLVRPAVRRAGLEDGRVGIGDGIAGVLVHHHQLFFDSQGEVHGGEVADASALGDSQDLMPQPGPRQLDRSRSRRPGIPMRPRVRFGSRVAPARRGAVPHLGQSACRCTP